MKQKKNVMEAELPKSDPRVKVLLTKLKKENYRPDSLIEILHTAQGAYGYLPMNVLAFITKQLKVPPSWVYASATFYSFFSLKPKGKHSCLVCTGTACYVKGAQAILDEVEKEFHLKPGEVTPDNNLGLQAARCIGACGLAPAVIVDEEVFAKVKPENITSTIHSKIGEAI